jgi:hypothetical protein
VLPVRQQGPPGSEWILSGGISGLEILFRSFPPCDMFCTPLSILFPYQRKVEDTWRIQMRPRGVGDELLIAEAEWSETAFEALRHRHRKVLRGRIACSWLHVRIRAGISQRLSRSGKKNQNGSQRGALHWSVFDSREPGVRRPPRKTTSARPSSSMDRRTFSIFDRSGAERSRITRSSVSRLWAIPRRDWKPT